MNMATTTPSPTTAHTPAPTTVRNLAARYDALYLDSYGVLVDSEGALPGAREFVAWVHDAGLPYLILTNDASKLPETRAERYARMGLPIPVERILTSGALLAEHFKAHDLSDAPCVVLGPQDSLDYVKRAGGVVVSAGDDAAEVIVACDDAGFPFLETVEAVLSQLFRALDAGRRPRLILPNPDLLYPKRPGEFGLTSGSIALLLEACIQARHPGLDWRFEPLGKPFPHLYRAAAEALPGLRAVMIGDQLGTDILGAQRAHLDSALIATGVGRWVEGDQAPCAPPTWLLPSLDPRL
jgi:HAD superfamily hydrolase (TIGR01450 family)